MSKVYFTDGLKIYSAAKGEVKAYESDFYNDYIAADESLKRSSAWKTSGSGAIFRGDYYPQNDAPVHCYFNSVVSAGDGSVLYSVTVNNVSAILEKDLTAEKDGEKHVIHDVDVIYDGARFDRTQKRIAVSVKRNDYVGHAAVFDVSTNDLITYTAGDSCDSDVCFSKTDNNALLFSTKGIARNQDGEFVRYSPSSIARLNLSSMQIEEIKSSDGFNYVRPEDDKNGNLYYIRKPASDKKRGFGRLLLDVILIPVKLIKAVYYFLETFTLAFTGETFTKKNPDSVKTRDKSPREIIIDGNKINAEKEYKANLRKKDEFAGIAPRSWELVKLCGGVETVIARGVIDYAVTDEGVVFTNGKNVVEVDASGKKTRVAQTSLCTKIGV